MLATLHTIRRDLGRAPTVSVDVPAEGATARSLAIGLELPIELIDGLFLNSRGVDLDARVLPGDRVAFVPLGTPASHPAFFGQFTSRAR
jgi:hypothetical protein